MNLPTQLHKDYLEKITDYAIQFDLNLFIIGSIYEGNPCNHASIDLVFVEEDYSVIKSFVNKYGIPIMVNTTTDPAGIAVIIYEDGITITLDIRNTITQEVLDNCHVINSNDYLKVSEELDRNTSFAGHLVYINSPEYNLIRLFHKSLISYLCNNKLNALKVLSEIIDFVAKYDDIHYGDDFIENFKLAYKVFFDNNLKIVNPKFDKLIHKLLSEV